MKTERRSFLKLSSLFAGGVLFSAPANTIAGITKKINNLQVRGSKVFIYHTNDLHGKISPSFENFGGLDNVRSKLEAQENSGLLLDAGDFTDSHLSFKEKKEVVHKMNLSGYHAVTPGNHELADGEEALANLIPYMEFAMVNCNYIFRNEALKRQVKPFVIIYSGPFKVGITGVGHEIAGIGYQDPVAAANQTAAYLKMKEHCNLVICLSHLGYEQAADIPDNKKLAENSVNIDMVIGGHNLKTLLGQKIIKNRYKEDVVLNQCGCNGCLVGKTEFHFNPEKQKSGFYSEQLIPGQNNDLSYANALQRVAGAQFA